MSLIYAFQHARKHVIKQRNSNTSLYAHRLAAQIRDLGAVSTALKGSSDLNPSDIADNIKASIKTYVDLFYSINKDERKEYLALFNGGKKTKIKPERNLLIIPALMAELKQPKDEISQALFYSLYRMPFKVLDDSRRSAFSIALLKRNMAITSVSSDIIDKFAKSMVKFESRMKMIEGGVHKSRRGRGNKGRLHRKGNRAIKNFRDKHRGSCRRESRNGRNYQNAHEQDNKKGKILII